MSDERFYQIIRDYVDQNPGRAFKLGNEIGCDDGEFLVCNN
jgi:hypothetical protein